MNSLFTSIVESHAKEKEFDETLKEFFLSIEPVYKEGIFPDSLYRQIVEPDHIISFPVIWIDDKGIRHTNQGYRVEFNNVLGPYKGGLRFHPSVNLSILKMLGFEQIFKNCLTGLPLGGGKGGSDFDPKGKSDNEVIAFCRAFMDHLASYLGPNKDVPAGDIGVGGREIRAMYEEYKKDTGRDDGALTGKPLDLGGSLGRTEATGFGLCYIVEKMLEVVRHDSFKNKTVVISGSGNVATYAAKKAIQLGAKVLAMSDSSCAVYDPDGIDVEAVKNIKEGHRGRIEEYLSSHHGANKIKSHEIWGVKADIYLPCATQFEIDLEDAKKIVSSKAIAVGEGANMPCTKEASKYLYDSGVLYLPGKASNAGGVAVSGLEMIQNAKKEHWSFEEVDTRLHSIMGEIFKNISNTAETYGRATDYVLGADIFSFKKVALAMMKRDEK
jgi:glutamate dehydrogenase (NADP+)